MKNKDAPMRRLLLASCISISLVLGGCATAEAPPVETVAVAAPATPGPALWKVADDDTTIYIFGTVHSLPDDVDWNSGLVEDAIAGSQSLVTEIDMTPESMAAMGPMVMSKAMLPEGQTLRALMNAEQRASYETALSNMGVPAEALDRFEPWFAAINIVQIMLQQAGYTGENGVEAVLEATVPAGTERVALETVEFQLDIFDTLPVESQVAYLLETVENPQEGLEMLGQIVEEWKVGNVDELAQMLLEVAESDPLLAERLFYARNANWAGWIDERLDQPGTVFMAVGAGHLAGEKSVQDYLRTRDIAVSRVQ